MFTFNRNYKDLEQVREYLPDFCARLGELTEAGEYRYNDSFKGHIPGIEGPDEDTAIYLLQGLERGEQLRAKVAELLNTGYEQITTIDAVTKFSHIIVYEDEDRMKGSSWQEWKDARLVPLGATGNLHGILPKGHRTNGVGINGRKVLVKR